MGEDITIGDFEEVFAAERLELREEQVQMAKYKVEKGRSLEGRRF